MLRLVKDSTWEVHCDGYDLDSFDRCTVKTSVVGLYYPSEVRQALANNGWKSGGTFGTTDYCPLH